MKNKILLFSMFIASIIKINAALPVFDPSNYMQSVLQRIEAVKQTAEQIQHTKNQLEQIRLETKNMMGLAGSLTTGQLQQLQNGLQFVLNTQNTIKSQINSFQNFENQFNNIYQDFKNFKNLDPSQYLSNANKLLENTKSIMYDGMRIAGIANPEKVKSTAERTRAIMSAANNAEGQKQVLQATALMAGQQIEALTELKTIAANNLKVQSAIAMQQVQGRALDDAHAESLLNPNMRDKQEIDKVDVNGFFE